MARKEQLTLLRRKKRVRKRGHAGHDGAQRQPFPAQALQRLAAGRASSTDVLSLQRTLGNDVVQRALADNGYATGLMRVGESAGAALETPARKKLQELADVDIGKLGERGAWSATPAVTAIMVTTMGIAKLVDELHPAQAGPAIVQLEEMLQQAKETAEAMEDPAEKEVARALIAAAAAIAAAILAVARLASRIEPRQMRTLATALSAYDPLPAKLLFVEAGKAAQTEAELVGLSQLVGNAQKAFEGKLEEARSKYQGNEELLKRLLSQFQQDADDKLKPAAWRT